MGMTKTVQRTELKTPDDLLIPCLPEKEIREEKNGNVTSAPKYRHQYVWRNIILMGYAHIGALYGLYLGVTKGDWTFWVYEFLLAYFSGVGITAGAHRLWTHKSYKAKLPLRIILATLQTLAFQNHIYEWSRDHRVHHKFSETDADPHNAKRGFFFSHVGWLLVRKHPDVKEKGKTVDMSDLDKDSVVVWQRRLYLLLVPVVSFVIPTWIPVHFWGWDPWLAWYGTLLRWVFSVNCTWTVNSAAHLWGPKPYDKNINPAESNTAIYLTPGEGFHNYHHTFPYDYKAAEMKYPVSNFTAKFIDFFADIGWAYDLKTVSEETVKRRILRTGDGSHSLYGKINAEEDKRDHYWGWGDKDMDESDYNIVNVINKKE